jgi:putative transposase
MAQETPLVAQVTPGTRRALLGAMTAPRQVLEGTTYLVTRRCTQRQFLLRPSKVTNAVFAYVLALASRRYGVDVHAYCVLSNHYHLVVTDPLARLPAFQQYLDGTVARAVNALLGHREDFWGPPSYTAVTLGSSQDIVEKAAYVLFNPVAAGLVSCGRKWPGLWSSPRTIGSEVQVPRPTHYFSNSGGQPQSIGFSLSAPPGFQSAQAFREALENALAACQAASASAGKSFLGVRRVLAQRPFARPRSREPLRTLRPRVAARDSQRRIELLVGLKLFLDAYREALSVWRDDRERALFPAGTYLMRVAHGVACSGAG